MRKVGNAQLWYNDRGKLHRDGDKPAVIVNTGLMQWVLHKKVHRDGGKPAVIHPTGWHEWWQNGHYCKGRRVTDFYEHSRRFAFVKAAVIA